MNRPHDEDFSVTGVSDASAGGLKLGLGYDAVGALTQLRVGASGSVLANYGYDVMGRLLQASDAAGCRRIYQRDYDAGVGRYVQSDPIGLMGGSGTFLYSLGRPLDRVDYDGLETVVIKSGSVEGNPFGHIAIATTGHGVYSYGTKHPYGSSTVDYIGSQLTERFVEVVRLKTSPTQEAAIRNSMEASRRQPYSVTSNNCATAVQGALSSAGVVGDHGHLLPGQVYTDALLSPSRVDSDVMMKGAPVPVKYSNF
ncbi:hypothetical protein [Stenotrophomonas chelatiphaga]|uniref:hypothetical protein n=1 Tax=Stenotrophomonas chelatiphaga TaxID=517011 RepID=UPI00289A5079|nr:hypothetical protein [Stenotrophomonas chelatiphaga]